MSDSIRSLLGSLVAPGSLLPEAEMERWRTTRLETLPAAVLAPSSDEELARVLSRASEEGWKVLPAGLGGWLLGGGPSEVSVVVSTRRMEAVSEYEPADLTLTAGAGLSLSSLRKRTEPHGQWLPMDPPGGLEGSVGAAVSLGISGPLRHLYGTPKDHVLGLTLVSGDGRVLRWGGRVVKNVAGFDVTRLSVGSWGSLGVVTSVSVRLFPIPEADVTLVFHGADVSTLMPLAGAMARSPLPLAAVELMDSLGPAAWDGGRSTAAGLVLRLLGSRALVAEMEARIRSDLLGEVGAPEKMAGEESQAFHGELNSWESGADLVIRLCLLPSEMGALLEEARALSSSLVSGRGAGTVQQRLSAHVGAGVLRIAVTGSPSEVDGLEAWASVLQGLRARLENQGGSLTLSSGPDSLVKRVGAWGALEGGKRLVEGLKAEFDPKRILAPGRLGL